MTEIEILKTALAQIGNLPLEFNTRARAIAQRTINRMGKCEWRIPLTDEEIYKAVDRGGMYPLPQMEEKKVESGGYHGSDSAQTNPDPRSEAVYPVDPTKYLPPAIEMIPVESSMLAGVGHDGNKTLRIRFRSGPPYDYIGIIETEFFDLVNSPSVGKAYNALVKAKGVKGIKLA